MATHTPHLNLLKKNVVTDGHETFNIETMLNENWDKIDGAFAMPVYGNEIHGLRVNENRNLEYYDTDQSNWVEIKSGVDGAPIQAKNYKIPATNDGQTDFQIPLATFDPDIDVMLVMQNRTVLESDEYSITKPNAYYHVTLVEPVKDYQNTSISLFIIKGNVMISDVVEIPTGSISQPGIVGLTNDLGESEALAVTQKALNDVATKKADKTAVENISQEVTNVKNKVTTFESEKNLSKERTNKDSEGIFTTVTYKRKKDNTIYCVSTLSGGETPLYTTRTEQYYDSTGTSVIDTQTYSLSYDDDGNLISEV